MRHKLGCSAVNCIAAHQYKTHIFLVIPGLLPEEDKTHGVIDHPLHSALEAIWARRAATFPFERP
jgi:hypothetical protein